MVTNLDENKLLKADKHEGNGETQLTSGVGVKGAWAEVIASTENFTNWLLLIIHDADAATDYSIDIGTGAAASEEVLIPDIKYHVSTAGNNIISVPYPFKVEIQKGTRISARCLNAAAVNIDIDIVLTGT